MSKEVPQEVYMGDSKHDFDAKECEKKEKNDKD